jgi:hypothetical protein
MCFTQVGSSIRMTFSLSMKSHYSECHFAECRIFTTIMSVVMPNVVLLIVVAVAVEAGWGNGLTPII